MTQLEWFISLFQLLDRLTQSQSDILGVHEELQDLDKSNYQVLAWRRSHTQSELWRVFFVELSLNHEWHSHRRLHLVGIGREVLLSRWLEVGLTSTLNFRRWDLEHFEIQGSLEEIGDLGKHLCNWHMSRGRIL